MKSPPQFTHSRVVEALPEREGRIAFRVRIGVTGHREFENREDVALEVADRLEEARALFPPTRYTRVVFSMLSALAEGADRLVVQAALDMEPALELELGAVLPLAVEDYLEDFKTDASRQEFKKLLSGAATCVELDKRQAPEGPKRDEAYERAGRYIVDRSDVLIAVWDGGEPHGHGGTAEVVEYARQCGVPVLVAHAKTGNGRRAPFLEDVGFPREAVRRRAAMEAFRRIDQYNGVSLRSARVRMRIGAERERLGKSLEGSTMHWRYMKVADWALPHLVRADKLAVENQRHHRILASAIHLLAAFAVTDVAVQTLFLSNEPMWLIGEVFLVSLLLLAVVTGRRARLHDRWLGYRSLAEAFRSALFISLSGGEDRRRVTGGQVLEPEEAWFQRAFSQAWRSCPEVELKHGDAASLRNFLVEAWIDHQVEYHRRTAARWRSLHSLATWMMAIFAGATIAVAVSHIAGLGKGSWVVDALKLAALILPAFGGAVAGLREYGQLRLHAERSKRAASRLRGLKDRMAVSTTLASVRRLAADTQRVTIDETVDWYGVVEFQDIDIVI